MSASAFRETIKKICVSSTNCAKRRRRRRRGKARTHEASGRVAKGGKKINAAIKITNKFQNANKQRNKTCTSNDTETRFFLKLNALQISKICIIPPSVVLMSRRCTLECSGKPRRFIKKPIWLIDRNQADFDDHSLEPWFTSSHRHIVTHCKRKRRKKLATRREEEKKLTLEYDEEEGVAGNNNKKKKTSQTRSQTIPHSTY